MPRPARRRRPRSLIPQPPAASATSTPSRSPSATAPSTNSSAPCATAPARNTSGSTASSARRASLGPHTLEPGDRPAQVLLLARLGAADSSQHLGRGGEALGRRRAPPPPPSRRRWATPRRWIDPAAPSARREPPRPHLFGHVGQERREQTQEDAQPEMQRRGRRPALRRVALVVGAHLHQLDEVVAEAPEQLLGRLQRQRVVELVERGRRARDQSCAGRRRTRGRAPR